MLVSNYRSTSSHDLLDCRMAMLGLDLDVVESRDSAMFEVIRQRCASCNFREPCELDLKRDPNDPVWRPIARTRRRSLRCRMRAG